MPESFAATTSAADWREWTGANVAVDGGGLTVATTTDRDRSQFTDGAVAIAAGPDGHATVVDGDGDCVRVAPDDGRRERLCPDPPWRSPVAACGRGDRVVVADDADGDLFVVSPRRRRPRRIETDVTDPVGVALAAGRPVVLDADGRLLSTRRGSRTDAVVDRIEGANRDLAAADGRLFVLCNRDEADAVRCYDAGAERFEESFALPSSLAPTAVAAGATGPLVAGTVDGDDTVIGELDADGFDRRCRVAGRCHALAAAGSDAFYGVFGSSQRVERVVERERPATHPRRGDRVGTATHRYDGGSDGTAWHRLRIDPSHQAPSTRIRVHYRATDDGRDTAADGDLPGEWTTLDVRGAQDYRLREACGRYLDVRLELVGTAEAAPRVDRLRAFCDRDPIGQFLPDRYDEGVGTALDGFLMAFETVFDGVEEDIEALTRYLDPEAAPVGALSWLESWFAVDGTDSWPESARRELLARAPELYRKRGTEAGVSELIALYRDHAEPDSAAPAGRDGPDTPAEGPFFFGTADFDGVPDGPDPDALTGLFPGGADVVCYCAPFETAAVRDAVADVVDRETPAHVTTAVAPLERSCSLDGATFLGVNSRLTRRAFELGTATLDGSSALDPRTDPEPHGQTTPLTDHN